MTLTIIGKNLFDLHFDLLVWLMSRPLTEEAGFMTYTAASHRGAIEMSQQLLESCHVIPLYYTDYSVSERESLHVVHMIMLHF